MLPIPNRVAFTFFGIDVMWYGILIALGMLLAILITYNRASRHNLDPEHVFNIILISLPAGIIGARIYYLAFNWERYAGDLYKMVNIREGGLAIHGGLIVGFITAALVCRFLRYGTLNVLDLAAPSIALAQAVGRWGNYFNQEAYGTPTTLPWAIEVNGEMVHPTFLYESIWCLLLFLVLSYVDSRRQFEGQVIFLYGILYSFERFFVEGLRTDSLMLGPLRVAQLVSIAVLVICLIAYIVQSIRSRSQGRIFY